MRVIGSFDPAAIGTSNQIDVGAADSGSKIMMYNRSIVDILINFENGSTDILHASEARWWTLDGYTPTLTWTVASILNTTTPPISQISIILYDPQETIVGNYPMSLIYQTNVGNIGGVNTNVSSTNAIDNEGNPAGTNIITAVPVGSTTPTVLVDNNGNATFANQVTSGSNGYHIIDHGGSNVPLIGQNTQNKLLLWLDGAPLEVRNADASLALSFDPANKLMLFNQAGGFGLIGPSGAVAMSTSLLNTYLNGSNSSNLQVGGNTILGALAGGIDAYQPLNMHDKLNLLHGSITRVGMISGSGSGSVAHGLGVVPSVVLPVCITANATMTVGYSGATSTNVTITVGSTYNWIAFLFAF